MPYFGHKAAVAQCQGLEQCISTKLCVFKGSQGVIGRESGQPVRVVMQGYTTRLRLRG
jgi:hypothetical protein